MEYLIALAFVVGMWNVRYFIRSAAREMKDPGMPYQPSQGLSQDEEHERRELHRLRHTPGSRF